MELLSPSTSGALGVHPVQRDIRVIARGSSFNQYDLVELDLAGSQSVVTDMLVGSETGGLVNVNTPTVNGVKYGFVHAVCLTAISVGQKGKARIMGQVPARCNSATTGIITKGDTLVASTDGRLEAHLQAGARYRAYALDSSSTVPAVINVLFDGVYGFGSHAAGVPPPPAPSTPNFLLMQQVDQELVFEEDDPWSLLNPPLVGTPSVPGDPNPGGDPEDPPGGGVGHGIVAIEGFSVGWEGGIDQMDFEGLIYV